MAWFSTGTVAIVSNGSGQRGTVDVYVGKSFNASVTYAAGSTAASVASSLAGQLNVSGSPVTASSDGGVVTLVWGFDPKSDFSLSASYSRGFQAIGSGYAPAGCELKATTLVSSGLNQQYVYDNWGPDADMDLDAGALQEVL